MLPFRAVNKSVILVYWPLACAGVLLALVCREALAGSEAGDGSAVFVETVASNLDRAAVAAHCLCREKTLGGFMDCVRETSSPNEKRVLKQHNWDERTGGKRAVWVSISDQTLRLIENGQIVWSARCATSVYGAGNEMDSEKTPVGWHRVVEKFGDGAPWGQVFRSKSRTDEIWRPGDDTTEDLVLTRILALAGEEPGKNQGGNVDSYARNIYIHGTNAEAAVGAPSSHGCIRLTNDEAIEAFERIPEGALVLITEE